MLSKHRVARSSLMSFLVAVLAAAPGVFAAQDPKDSAEVSRLLSEARTESAQLANEAQEMKSYTTSKHDWTHTGRIERIKEHVNNVGGLVFELNSARSTASSAQQEAIDRVDPLLDELASSVNATATQLSRASAALQMPPYKDYVEANARLATNLAKLVSDFVDYSEAKTRSEELEHELDNINHD